MQYTDRKERQNNDNGPLFVVKYVEHEVIFMYGDLFKL